jgi:hypothetical protein
MMTKMMATEPSEEHRKKQGNLNDFPVLPWPGKHTGAPSDLSEIVVNRLEAD